MVKIKAIDWFEDIEVKRILYRLQYESDPLNIDDFREFMADDRKIHRKFDKIFGSRPAGSLERSLETFGASGIIIESLCDDHLKWKGSQIIGSIVRDGAQAQRFLEYCFNTYSVMSDTPTQRKISFSDIHFGIRQSNEGKMLNLFTDATTPASSQVEKYCIFIYELNMDATIIDELNRNVPVKSKFKRLINKCILMGAIVAGLALPSGLYLNYQNEEDTHRQLEQINGELDQIQTVRDRYIMEYSEMRAHGQLIHSPSGEEYGYFSTGDPRFPQQRLFVSDYRREVSKLKSQEDELKEKLEELNLK